MQVWKIDENGFFTGESYFAENPSSNEIKIPIIAGYVRTKFNGTEWIEGATQGEILVWELENKIEPQPTELEILKLEQAKANAEIIELMIGMIYGGGF